MYLLNVLSISLSVLVSIRNVTAKSISEVESRIYSGEDVKPGEQKHLVRLIIDISPQMQSICSGSIISDRLIVTAAHCICRPQIRVTAFSYPKQVVGFGDNTFVHPKFKSCGAKGISVLQTVFDIGLLQTQNRIIFSGYVQPIRISFAGVQLGDLVTIAGYGQTEKEDYTEVPKQGTVAVTKCNSGTNICSRGLPRTLRGDSGGPVMYKGQLIAITSTGSCDRETVMNHNNCFSYYAKIEALAEVLKMIQPTLINFSELK